MTASGLKLVSTHNTLLPSMYSIGRTQFSPMDHSVKNVVEDFVQLTWSSESQFRWSFKQDLLSGGSEVLDH